jgi:hypothetical protein
MYKQQTFSMETTDYISGRVDKHGGGQAYDRSSD